MASGNIPIQLFSACSTLGEITPLWFRFENEEHGIETIKVERILSQKEEKHCGLNYIRYVCWAAAEDKEHLVELRYSISSHQWKLFQVLT